MPVLLRIDRTRVSKNKAPNACDAERCPNRLVCGGIIARQHAGRTTRRPPRDIRDPSWPADDEHGEMASLPEHRGRPEYAASIVGASSLIAPARGCIFSSWCSPPWSERTKSMYADRERRMNSCKRDPF